MFLHICCINLTWWKRQTQGNDRKLCWFDFIAKTCHLYVKFFSAGSALNVKCLSKWANRVCRSDYKPPPDCTYTHFLFCSYSVRVRCYPPLRSVVTAVTPPTTTDTELTMNRWAPLSGFQQGLHGDVTAGALMLWCQEGACVCDDDISSCGEHSVDGKVSHS